MQLIVIEGIDGSGKQTQADLLSSRLEGTGSKVVRLTFPNYESSSSALVKMYLNGEFGDSATAINPYAAGAFYAVDRFATFSQNPNFANADYIIADRYATSNMIHQAAKLEGKERGDFLNWVIEFEYSLLKIPKPSHVFFLDVPPQTAQKLTMDRTAKFEGKDIHEQNRQYMQACYDCAKYCAEKYDWEVVNCAPNGEIISIDDIHNKLWRNIKL